MTRKLASVGLATTMLWLLPGCGPGQDQADDYGRLFQQIEKEDLGIEVSCFGRKLMGAREITAWPAGNQPRADVTQGFRNKNPTIPYSCGWHSGIDIGTTGAIKAAGAGKVIYIGDAWELEANVRARYRPQFDAVLSRKGPHAVIIAHGERTFSVYGHGSSADRQLLGKCVMPGQRVGTIGNTGFSFGAHLHFEVITSETLRLDPQTRRVIWQQPFGADDCGHFQDPIRYF